MLTPRLTTEQTKRAREHVTALEEATKAARAVREHERRGPGRRPKQASRDPRLCKAIAGIQNAMPAVRRLRGRLIFLSVDDSFRQRAERVSLAAQQEKHSLRRLLKDRGSCS